MRSMRWSSFRAMPAVLAGAALLTCAGPARATGGEVADGGRVSGGGTAQAGGTWGEATELPGLAALNAGGDAEVAQVSCPSPGNCAAGGYYSKRHGSSRPFVATERNGRWDRAIEVPGMAAFNAGGGAEIDSVSCPSPGNCGADGTYTTRSGFTAPFLVTERAGRWGQAIKVPGLARVNVGRWGAGVGSVSCPSPGNCVTGGYYTSRSHSTLGFVAAETGGRWSRAFTVSGAENITSASCSSPGDCTAAGDASDLIHPIEVSETGGHWGQPVKIGVASALANFTPLVNTISCPSPGNCAVGGTLLDNSTESANTAAFVVSESDGSWSQLLEVPGTAVLNLNDYAAIDMVSCPSPGDCAAVGSYTDPSAHPQGFVIDETAGEWGQLLQVPGLAKLNVGEYGEVAAVSCPSAGDCAAGGHYANRAGFQGFVASAADGEWGRAMRVPGLARLNVGGAAEITSVSCPSAGHCTAVGDYASDRSPRIQAFVVSES